MRKIEREVISLNGHKKGIKVIFGLWKIWRKENRQEKSKENKKILSVYDHGKDATVNVKYKSCEIGTRGSCMKFFILI